MASGREATIEKTTQKVHTIDLGGSWLELKERAAHFYDALLSRNCMGGQIFT